MVRRHFIAGDVKPSFIITYYAPQHIPFAGGYTGILRGYGSNTEYGNENNTVFKCVLDKWSDGVGQYGIKMLNDTHGLWYNQWSSRYSEFLFTDLNFGRLGNYVDIIDNNPKYQMFLSSTITDIILPNEIKHLRGTLVSDLYDSFNDSVVNVTLPENLESLDNNVLYSLHSLKNITIPATVNYMGHSTLLISCNKDLSDTLIPDNRSLEEIILKPYNPPQTDTHLLPIGVYDPLHFYINPNLKIRVYADCLDTYKNDSVWGQYSDLYDTINNAIVWHRSNGKREIYETDDNIYEIKKNDISGSASRIYLPNTTYLIRANAFESSNLTDISMPSVTEIEEAAFTQSDLKTINMPRVNKIGNYAFEGCRDLTSVTISQQASIGDYAFRSCSSLKFITIPENLSQIGTNAFYSCRFGKNNIIGDYDKIKAAGAEIYDVETEDGHFISKYSEGDILEQIRPYVKNVIISDDIKYIGHKHFNTFYDNRIIESIYIGKNVKGNERGGVDTDNRLHLELGYSDNIKSLKVDPLNPYYDSRNDCNAVIETATNTLLVGCPTTTIPNTVEIIEYNRAFDRIKINTLNIPLSVNKIIDMHRADTYNYTQINTIIYEGTIEQWDAIEKSGAVYEKAAITIKCSDGEIKYFTETNV